MENIENKVTAIETLLKAFRIERILFLSVSIFAALILIAAAVFILFENPNQKEWFFSLFAPAGVITYSSGQILKMWNDAIAIINNQKISSNEKNK